MKKFRLTALLLVGLLCFNIVDISQFSDPYYSDAIPANILGSEYF